MWKLRNRACFEKKLIKSSADIICYYVSSLKYWVGLQKERERDKTMILEGAKFL
jgi:hypothetical protein